MEMALPEPLCLSRGDKDSFREQQQGDCRVQQGQDLGPCNRHQADRWHLSSETKLPQCRRQLRPLVCWHQAAPKKRVCMKLEPPTHTAGGAGEEEGNTSNF